MPVNKWIIGEMVEKRTKNSKHFLLSDGSIQAEIHMGDIHFDDESGNLHNINTDLQDDADFDLWDLPVAREGKEAFKLAKELAKADKKANKLNRDNFDYQALQVPYELKIGKNFKRGYTIGKGADKLTFKPFKASPSKAYQDANKVIYQDAWNDTDVTLEVLSDRVKETFILKTDKAPSKFIFEVTGPLLDDLTAGQLRLAPAWLKDAEGTERDVLQTVRRDGTKVYIDLIADVIGLVYPIEIDPTITINTTTIRIIKDRSPSDNFDGSNTFVVGRDVATGTKTRTLLKIDLNSISGIVSFASLKLVGLYEGTTTNRTIFVNKITSSWDVETLSWDNQPSHIEDTSFSYTDPKAFNIDVLNIVSDWVNNPINNYGFILINLSEATDGSDKYFAGHAYSNESYRPVLTIIYNTPPTIPTVTSPNGNETWNSLHTIQWLASTDEDTPQANLRYQIQLSTDNGATWQDIVALTTAGVTSYNYDFINEPETSVALVRIRAYDGAIYGSWDVSDGVFAIEHDHAPTEPTNLSPNGTVKDRAATVRFSWQHNDSNSNDPQSKFDLQWRLQGAGTWNTITEITINQYYDIPANTLPLGTIEWQVRTYDQTGLSSPYSALTTFSAQDKSATPTITSPTDLSTVSVANPVVQWSSVGQVEYNIVVRDALDTTTIWESTATSGNKAVTVATDLENNTDYIIKLRIKDAGGLWSDYGIITVTVSYTPPAIPSISTTKGNAIIIISVDNPIPSGSEPNVSYNSIYRRKLGDSDWCRIATDIPVSSAFVDYTPASNQIYEYYVRTWGDNGTYSDSFILSESITYTGVWLHVADNPLYTLHQFKYDGGGRNDNWQAVATMMQFAGRRLPVAEYDDNEQQSINLNLKIVKDSDDKIALEKMIKSKNTLCYRDGRGRKMYCHAFQLPIEDIFFGNNVSLTLEEVSYTEEV